MTAPSGDGTTTARVALLLVSHSSTLADGAADLAAQMAPNVLLVAERRKRISEAQRGTESRFAVGRFRNQSDSSCTLGVGWTPDMPQVRRNGAVLGRGPSVDSSGSLT